MIYYTFTIDPYVWKLPSRLAESKQYPIRYGRKARLATAVQLLAWTTYNEQNFHKVTTPFITLHGTTDKVTDPQGSQKLYDSAGSTDKSIKLYDNCYHCLLTGEDDDTASKIFNDIHEWISKRV